MLYPAYWLQPNSLNMYASAFCLVCSLVRPHCGQHLEWPRLNSMFSSVDRFILIHFFKLLYIRMGADDGSN